MKEAIPLVVGAAVVAATCVAFVYVITNPYIVLPAIALVAFLCWRGYRRSKV
jgi:hypothetical protein